MHCPPSFAQRTIISMCFRLRSTLLLPLVAFIGCARSNPAGVGGGISFSPVAGDYVINVAAGTSNASYFTGNLNISGSTASGVFRYTNPAVCVSGTQDIPFTGSFANNILTLTSSSFSNSVATLTISLPQIANNIGGQNASGTAVIAGGTCALASSPLLAQYFQSYAGIWSITLTSPTAQAATLTVVQSAANADGQYPATGTLTQGTTQTAMTGLVSGPYLNLANTGSTITLSANALSSPVFVSISGTSGGNGTMTH
jgi:hypothetical protein